MFTTNLFDTPYVKVPIKLVFYTFPIFSQNSIFLLKKLSRKIFLGIILQDEFRCRQKNKETKLLSKNVSFQNNDSFLEDDESFYV